jgi:hypothetical protein
MEGGDSIPNGTGYSPKIQQSFSKPPRLPEKGGDAPARKTIIGEIP